MPTAFTDPSSTLYIALAAMVFILGAMAYSRRRKPDIVCFALGTAALVSLYLIDSMNESPREIAVKKANEMSKAFNAKNYDDMFKHISDKFKYKSLDKKGLREKANHPMAKDIGLEVWGYERSEYKVVDETTIEIAFAIQPSGYPNLRRHCVGTFKKESDGEWRMVTFKLYNPVNRNQEDDWPGL